MCRIKIQDPSIDIHRIKIKLLFYNISSIIISSSYKYGKYYFYCISAAKMLSTTLCCHSCTYYRVGNAAQHEVQIRNY